MRRITLKHADAAQLRQELEARGIVAAVKEENGAVVVEAGDDVDGVAVDYALRDHFPRSFILEILAVDFQVVDFETPTTLAGLKVELNKMKQRNIQLRNRTAAVLKVMLRQD